MNRRRKRDYDIVMEALHKKAKDQKVKLNPKYIMTDFELAAINSFRDNFEGIESKGCMFHFCQSLMKKMNNLGLKSDYENDEKLANWFKSLCCLAIVPLNEVELLFEKMLAAQPTNSKVDKFMDYFVATYFEGSYKVEMWNHFKTNGTPRTNNNPFVEKKEQKCSSLR
jgi:hypothetical protein